MQDAKLHDRRERIIEAAVKVHDERYSTTHCSRKYIMACHKMGAIILEVGKDVE